MTEVDSRRDRVVSKIRRLRGTIRPKPDPPLELRPDLPVADIGRLRDHISHLLDLQESTSQREAAAEVAAIYLDLDDEGRERFFSLVAEEFGPDNEAVDRRLADLTEATDAAARRHAQRMLRQALAPQSTALLHHFTSLDSGVKFLVDMRADLRRVRSDSDDFRDLDLELRDHLSTLFDVGLLRLRRITWESPAGLLEKLIEYEAVHAIDGWDDLKSRLDSDRRCYAFFHPAMPDEPLIFVEIALTNGMAGHLPTVLNDRENPVISTVADTAIFYSISNCQPGLAGVNLGNELLKQVVDELTHALPNLQTFATLSPVPEFRNWLENQVGELPQSGGTLLNGVPTNPSADPNVLIDQLAHHGWADDSDFVDSVRPWLVELCAIYLTTPVDGRCVDPVGNFHLSNGASVERINWMANPRSAGLQRSFGLMVNYRYSLADITPNAEAYSRTATIATSDEVKALRGG